MLLNMAKSPDNRFSKRFLIRAKNFVWPACATIARGFFCWHQDNEMVREICAALLMTGILLILPTGSNALAAIHLFRGVTANLFHSATEYTPAKFG